MKFRQITIFFNIWFHSSGIHIYSITKPISNTIVTKFLLKQNSVHEISNCNLSYQRFIFIKVCFYSWKTTTHTIHLTSQNTWLATQKRTTKIIYYAFFWHHFSFPVVNTVHTTITNKTLFRLVFSYWHHDYHNNLLFDGNKTILS